MNNKRQFIDRLFDANYVDTEVQEALEEIEKLQRRETQTLRTGIPHMDFFLFDGLTNKMVFIGSRPGMGKTHNCARVIKNLLDNDINPENVSILRLNWEMQTKSLLLRNIKMYLKKSMRQILSKPFEAEEMEAVTEAVNEIKNPKIKNISEIIEGADLEYMLEAFCKSGDPNEEKVVLIDHLHILNDKDRIDRFLSICNQFKLRYKKLSFIFYFQLNRTLENLWRGKDSNPRNYRPNSSHIYNTDNLMQYADIICTMVIPQVVNLDNYAVVNKKYCPNLEEHFIDEGDSNWVKLEGRNRVYFDYIKVRMVDDFDDPRLYCEILSLQKEEEMKGEVQDELPAFMKTGNQVVDSGNLLMPMHLEDPEEGDDDIPF